MKKTLLLMLMTATMALADVPWVEDATNRAWDVHLQLRNDYSHAPARVRPEIKSILIEFLRIDLEMDLARLQDETIPKQAMQRYLQGLIALTARLQNLPKEQAQLADMWIETIEDLQQQLISIK